MHSFSKILDACDAVGRLAREIGVGLLDAEDQTLDGRTVQVDGRRLLNFSSCSYLGLELDSRLIEGAVDATRRFGTQFSASRAFLSAPPYRELESLLAENTGRPTLVLPSTSQANAAALPSLIEPDDIVLLDPHVHMSVQIVMPLLEKIGVRVETLPFGPEADGDRLESRLHALAPKYRRIWLLIDGIYSMHGKRAPLEALRYLLEHHPALHLYVDDAHGTSWTGRHGRGHALDALARSERVVVALSLNKSFAAGGGALCFPNERLLERVRHTSVPANFSGPLQPPMLGAALASARIHASPEIEQLQRDLLHRIEYVNRRAAELDLPLLHGDQAVPIRFIGIGPQAASIAIARHLFERGLLPSCALFPAVGVTQTGIRLGITRHHRYDDLDLLLETIAAELPNALAAAGSDRTGLDRAFGLKSRVGPRDGS